MTLRHLINQNYQSAPLALPSRLQFPQRFSIRFVEIRSSDNQPQCRAKLQMSDFIETAFPGHGTAFQIISSVNPTVQPLSIYYNYAAL
jgi:hypothetical protein